MAAPAKEEAPAPAVQEEPAYQQEAPVIEDEYEEEYDEPYEEEEDDFVAPNRPQDVNREEVYMPKGGYDTLKIEPVDVEEEQVEMRGRRRRPAAQFEEEAPRRRSRRQAPVQEEVEDVQDDYYDDDYEEEYEEVKPRNKGLFIFCIILNVILIIILLWFLGGLLVNLGVLPDIDLGYSWFNAHIYPLF